MDPGSDPKDAIHKRVHFSTEQQNLDEETGVVTGAESNQPGAGPDTVSSQLRSQRGVKGSERGVRGLVGSPPTQLYANGGASPGLSLVLLPSVCPAPGPSGVWEGELRELEGKIDEFQGKLRLALVRRVELQRNLQKERRRKVERRSIKETNKRR